MTEQPHIRFIATDVDGTLAIVGKVDGVPVDAYAFGEACVANVSRTHPGLDADLLTTFRQFGRDHLPGKSYEDSYDMLHKFSEDEGLPIPPRHHDGALGFFKSAYDKIFANEIPKSSTARLAVVQALRDAEKDGAVIMAVSNSGRQVVDANLELCGFDHLHNTISADEVPYSKPNPDMYETMYRDMQDLVAGMGKTGNPTMVCIEDSMTGFKAAIEAAHELRNQGLGNVVEVLGVPLDLETQKKMEQFAKENPGAKVKIFQPEVDGNTQLKSQVLSALRP